MIHTLCKLEATEEFSRTFPDKYSIVELERLLPAACELAERLRRRVAHLQMIQAAGGEA